MTRAKRVARNLLTVAAVTVAGLIPRCLKRSGPWPLRVAAALAPLAAVVACAQAANTPHRSPKCTSLDHGFSSSFEIHYHAPGGLDPNACGPVYGTKPGDKVRGAHTWMVNTSAYSGVPRNCIRQGRPPKPGKGRYAVQIHADAHSASNRFAEDCIWMNNWRYIKYPANTYYGLMWYFPKGAYKDPAPGNHDVTTEWNFHPYIFAAPLGLSLHGDTLQVYVNTGAWRKCHGCEAQFHNGGEYEHPSAHQDNMAPIWDWRVIPKGHLKRNTWIETIVRVHWANNNSGSIRAWWRLKGQSRWKETVNQRGFPTIAWGPDSSQHFRWTPYNENGVTTVDHIGVYRTGVHPAPATTFWIDNYQRQPTFAAVAKTMP